MKDEPVAVKINKVIFFMNKIYPVVGIALSKKRVINRRFLPIACCQLSIAHCHSIGLFDG
jgi:hypothetical protein